MSTKWRRYNLGQKVWKALKFETSRRVIIVHLHIGVVKILQKTFIAFYTDVVSFPKLILEKNS